MAAIKIERLSKQFDGSAAAAVHDLSLDIAGSLRAVCTARTGRRISVG